jgi:glycosyltransferase involved in cell wall biosynthesis
MTPYTAGGWRRILPPLVYGVGVFLHLLRHGRRYDVVDTGAFAYFSLLAAAALRPLMRYELVVDWFEVWSRTYWREYLGGAGGRIGERVQRLCARILQHAFCFSELHAGRLREEHLNGPMAVLRGLYAGATDPPTPTATEPIVLFAGRLIPEKHVTLAVAAIALAAARIDGMRAEILGDERQELEAAVQSHGCRTSSRREASPTARRSNPRCAARCACCLPRVARGTAWWSSRPPRAARQAS